MLATVLIDPPSVAALGAIFIIFGARSIAAGSPLRRSVLIGAVVGAWMGICFGNHAFRYPAWMLCYLIDPAGLPTAVWYPVFLAVLIGCGALGALVAHRLIAQGRRRTALGFAAVLLLVWLALFGLTLDRYVVIGTWQEFHAGSARPLAAQPEVIRQFNLVTLATAVPLLALLGGILWQNRRAKAAGALQRPPPG